MSSSVKPKRQRPPPTAAQRTQIKLFLDSGALARLQINLAHFSQSLSGAELAASRIVIESVQKARAANQYAMRNIQK